MERIPKNEIIWRYKRLFLPETGCKPDFIFLSKTTITSPVSNNQIESLTVLLGTRFSQKCIKIYQLFLDSLLL